MRIRDWRRLEKYAQTGQNRLGATAVILIYRWIDPLQLPRFVADNWPSEIFEKYMRAFMQTC